MDEVKLKIESSKKSLAELKTKLYLFQALPKQDKMEFIIQKAVELGVHEIVPIVTKRCIVKLDDLKKQEKKTARWNAISEAAAKQSARGIIPEVKKPMKLSDALEYASKLEYNIFPFEHAAVQADVMAVLQGRFSVIKDRIDQFQISSAKQRTLSGKKRLPEFFLFVSHMIVSFDFL